MSASTGPQTVVLYVIIALLSAFFLYFGFTKVSSAAEPVALFTRYGLPTAFMILIGVCEMAGGIGLWIPRVSLLAAIGLIGVMLGAIAMHVIHDPLQNAVPAIIASVLLLIVIYLRRSTLRTMY